MDRSAAVEVSEDENEVSQVLLCNPRGASARISLHGGQVRSWKTERGEDLLFTSSKANLNPPAAVRGGIPICFPKFGNQVSVEQHGFVRNRMWIIDENPAPLQSIDSSTGIASIDLVYKSTDADLRFWPHRFELRLRVILSVDGSLTLISRVRNVDSKPFTFAFAYHTYFSIGDIRYRWGSRSGGKEDFCDKKKGLPDVVVWNPWDQKSKTIPDFGKDEYKFMLCVDAAAIENPITLKPGEEWTGQVEFSVTSLKY
ncbi:hypothetical protein DH2020_005642 [Rehmannia glutinosa]|uniref:glucose-6-phosphate 1-epimerase n=1 Tax=Rehmannia glutinosa TaxID=99300 RepID=A0ABR0XGK2_REHGL